jgi:hypothetical protein
MKKLDFSVAILAGASCLLMYINVPVWGVFIGWAWYFTLGASPGLLKKAVLPSIAGSALAVAAFLLIDLFSLAAPPMAATILSVVITVFALMMTLKAEIFNPSLISFNAYSCIFVGYGAGAYLAVEGMPPLLNAAIWITGANYLGLAFGWLSIFISGLGAKKA